MYGLLLRLTPSRPWGLNGASSMGGVLYGWNPPKGIWWYWGVTGDGVW